MKAITALATLYRQGGVTVVTPSEGEPALRSVIQADGDVFTAATHRLSETLVDQHVAAIQAKVGELRTARKQVIAALIATITGAGVLAVGLSTDWETSTWLAWLGGGGTSLPVGAGLMAALRLRRWFKGRGGFGPPRAA